MLAREYILSAVIVSQKRWSNEHLIGSVKAILVAHAADNGISQQRSCFFRLSVYPGEERGSENSQTGEANRRSSELIVLPTGQSGIVLLE